MVDHPWSLATNLHDVGVAGSLIRAILRHSDVSVTRQAYIKDDAVDPVVWRRWKRWNWQYATNMQPAPMPKTAKVL
jgi:hypothetical protein